ncbi:MAG: peptidoglycan editing factor PgeF [Prevotella sp.]|nr:peptidoglycan editing factor PgeF [Bacteroides sp.]MCM1366496.1 peptidoglycan editing factor PgeF [Prevotella sp.]MCM1436835.1 peptidoglycan editing factor PgeF [Prevotella sp.]
MRFRDIPLRYRYMTDLGCGVVAGFTCGIPVSESLCMEISEETLLAQCEQTHSVNVQEVCSASDYPENTDGIITGIPGFAIGVRTADCVPVLLYAPDIRKVAAVHAGWRGTLGRILDVAIDKLRQSGANPASIQAVIGPCVCVDCYEVDKELASKFVVAGFGPEEIIGLDTDKPHLNLAAINAKILIENGVKEKSIKMTNMCTRHYMEAGEYPFPSYRRNPGTSDRLHSFIMLSPNNNS